jgi:leucyl-tRNA synthetase
VDFYVGGAEHATRHLIYARFWHRFLFDNGLVSQPEPFKKLQHVGLIMGADGRKMSKRWGNVINPDDVVERLGADSLRVYEIFMGPFDQAIAWNTDNLVGARRFLERVWRLQFKVGRKEKITLTTYNLQLTTLLHKTIKKVTEDITAFKFNTAISQLMILTGALEREETIPVSSFRTLTLLLAPFAPHTAEELWEILGEEGSVHTVEWPSHDEAMISSASVSVAVQVNGKIRARMIISPDLDENMALQQALSLPEVTKWLGKEQPRKVVYVKGKIISIVT